MINVKDYKHVVHNTSPLVVEIFDFITEEENSMFFDTIKYFDFKKSSVVGDVNNPNIVNNKRTSMSISLPFFVSNFTETIIFKISNITGVTPNKFEELQVLKYEIGEKFTPHFDRYETDNEKIIGTRGQRIATNILYLNDDYEGGSLIFSRLKLNIKPKKNSLIYFEYNEKNYKDTIHGSSRILKGTKYAMTCWIVEKSYGDYYGPKSINSNIEIAAIS